MDILQKSNWMAKIFHVSVILQIFFVVGIRGFMHLHAYFPFFRAVHCTEKEHWQESKTTKAFAFHVQTTIQDEETT